MDQVGIPIVHRVEIHNDDVPRVAGTVALQVLPDLGDGVKVAIPALAPDESFATEIVDLRLPIARLRAQVEAERASLVARYEVAGGEVARYEAPIDVLAYNEWPGLLAPPALLACFVTPNHPVVAPVLRRVSERLHALTGDNAINGYQSRSPKRVLAMVRAVYETLQSLGLSYAEVPASFEEVGQKVRLPDVVLRDRLGNCLDVTLLVASLLEQMGLSPLLVVIRGHAFPGAWLIEERFPEGVVGDAARLRNGVALDQLVFFDSSSMVHDPSPAFNTAVGVAAGLLADDARFAFAVDVRVVRAERFRPLPLRAPVAVLPGDDPMETGDAPESVREILHEASLEPVDDVDLDEPVTPPPPEPVVARFKQWRGRLLDLSLRNKLLNFRADVKGALPLDVPDVAVFEDKLAAGTAFDLLPKPALDPLHQRDGALVDARGGADERKRRLVADLQHGIVHATVDETQLLARAVLLDREARLGLEDGGANTLYVAIGMLRWFESDSSDQPRLAPLLLVPVQLEYQRALRRVKLRIHGDDPLPNVTLVEKLRQDFAVDMSGVTRLDADESGVDVPGLLRAARVAVARMKRWEVVEEAHLGLFSFTKFLMWRDLLENQAELLASPVVQHIASGRTDTFRNTVAAADPRALDDSVAPARLPLVLDADSTQTAAVVSALGGRNFVLQGPPGTGKSQTIANLIAAAIAEGRSVLFVAEKMAALDVVHRRLEQVGLGDFCLELHSAKANKKDVVDSLGRSLDRVRRATAPAWEARSAEVEAARSELNAYVRALHAPRALGSTFYQATARALALADAADVAFPSTDAATLDEATFRARMDAAEKLAIAATNAEPVEGNPWRDCAVTGWSAGGERDVKAKIDEATDAIDGLSTASAALAEALGDRATTIAAMERQIELACILASGTFVVRDARSEAWLAAADDWLSRARADKVQRTDLATRWRDDLWTLDDRWRALFERWATAFFLFAWIALWGARQQLGAHARGRLGSNVDVLRDLTSARQLTETTSQLDADAARLREALPDWNGDIDALAERVARTRAVSRVLETSTASTAAVATWATASADGRRGDLRARADALSAALGRFQSADQALAAALSTRPVDLAATRARLDAWRRAFPTFRAWALYRQAAVAAERVGLSPIVRAHARGELRAPGFVAATERGMLTNWIAWVRDGEPALRDFDGPNRHRLVERFRRLDAAHVVELGPKRVAALVEARLPAVDANPADGSEAGILRREMRKKTRHLPVRKLLREVRNLLPRLKPCLLMSPLSVAQYLPAGGKRFDLVVFDEASQICTHDAIGALARGNQVVVVGDSKQLPPTSFFQRAIGDDAPVDDNDIVELESILDEAVAAGLPEQSLGWHYRSRHEALIRFSNESYYDGHLNVFPAARGRVADRGVHFHRVPDGVYEKGASRTNKAEATALVRHLVASLKATMPGDRTFGVVTFSQAQQTLISDLLDEARRASPEIEPHFAGFEGVFVKNLENVQGDERDEILFSVGYGPDEQGRVWMNFGPLNRAGGERRLNVAVTRARLALHVFSTLTDDQIDLSRTQAKGARHLKAFLRYAAEQSAPPRTTHQGDFDSDFERQVFDALTAHGWRVDTQVGCGGYRIDIAIVHPEEPGVYMLGVECDGAPYHSAATARDRDRLRQQVLEGLGWRLHRIWSTDWWFDRESEIARLEAAIDQALKAPKVVAQAAVPPQDEETVDDISLDEPIDPPSTAPDDPSTPYLTAMVSPVSKDPASLHDPRYTAALLAVCEAIVAVESPILLDELGRRVLPAFGAASLTDRARRRIKEVGGRSLAFCVVGDTCWRTDDDPTYWATWRTGNRDADAIPVDEIAAAAAWVLARNVSMPRESLARETARRFGIQRFGKKVAARMLEGVELLERRGRCKPDGDRLVWGPR